MKNVHYITKVAEQSNQNRAMCIGFFDGVHRGHMSLINQTIEIAQKMNLLATLFTFSVAPKAIVGGINRPYLTSLQDKVKRAEQAGIAEIIVLNFDKEVVEYSVEEFMNKVIKPLNVKYLICGFDFRFAKNGLGNAQVLKSLESHDFHVIVVPEVSQNGEKIASTKIIEDIQQGNLERANQMLGYNYTIIGQVVKGNGNGRKLGFPTANIDYQSYVKPLNGVYAVRVKVGACYYKGMVNIGYRPTITSTPAPILEVHIFDFDSNIYNQIISVEFIKFIRQEIKFSNISDLVNQLITDQKTIKSCF